MGRRWTPARSVARLLPSGPDFASPGDARVIRRSPSQLTALRRVPVGRPPPARPGGRQSGGGGGGFPTRGGRAGHRVRGAGGGGATRAAGDAGTGPGGAGGGAAP